MAIFLAIFLFVLIRTAWISDDAAITLRTVLNFIHGYGPKFNIDERVQAYTHPLWFFIIAGVSIIVDNVFIATFLLSISVSLVSLWMLFSFVSTNFFATLVAVLAFILSKAYVDFSTSGLENPLSHLLLLLSVTLAIRVMDTKDVKNLALFFASHSLIYLNRQDLLVLILPLAVVIFIKHFANFGNLVKAVAIGSSPVIAWTAFSTYYYGFPFPNTTYAKLGTGISFNEQFIQGTNYLLHSIETDPITPTLILVGVIVGLFSSWISASLALGSIFYIIYIIIIGGDFMEGRFLTTPLLIAAIILSRSNLRNYQVSLILIGVLSLGLVNINSTILSGSGYTNKNISTNGIADERGFYYQRYGLLTAAKETFAKPNWVIGERNVAIICGGLGFAGIFGGPGTHYIDECGLADPLLARLPAKYDPNWRIGHFVRQLPTEYKESIERNDNLIKNPKTKLFYESIRTITRNSLNDPKRFREIIWMNLNKIEKPNLDIY